MIDRPSRREGIIIVQIEDDGRRADLYRLLELSRRSCEDVVVIPPPPPNLPVPEDMKLTLDLSVLASFPRRSRKSKWRKPSERGRR